MNPDLPKYNGGLSSYTMKLLYSQEIYSLIMQEQEVHRSIPLNKGIYKINAPHVAQVKDLACDKKEKPMSSITRLNVLALLALVQNDKDSTADLLPGAAQEGLFADALKKAETERKEEALKALTSVAKTIQTSVAEQKAELRASIRSLREQERRYQAKLNEIDAAAVSLGGTSPNPFPLLRTLGLVGLYDTGLSTEEWNKLTAVAPQA